MRMVFETNSPEETAELGASLGRSLIGAATLALIGPLGAGKTQFVKGIARGNGADDARQVTSPTFTLVHEYGGRLTLFHVDAYRLSGPPDLLSLGFEELVRPDSAVVVEWADRVRQALPDDALWIQLSVTGANQRRLEVLPMGRISQGLLEAFQSASR